MDRLESDIKAKVRHTELPIARNVHRLEDALTLLQDQAAARRLGLGVHTNLLVYLEVLCCFLTAHHVQLQYGFYSERRAQQNLILQNVGVIASSTTTANKLNGGASPWSMSFLPEAKLLGVTDEVQGLGRCEVSGVRSGKPALAADPSIPFFMLARRCRRPH